MARRRTRADASPPRPPSRRRRPRSPSPATAAPAPPVRVRMYRQGLGDCLLLTFGEGDAARHMLIDCGTLGTRTNPDNSMTRVVRDIRDATGDRLTILVATHEHKDHVSGFRKSLWDGVKVDRVWMAWTEDPESELAQQLEVYENDLRAALVAAIRAAPGAATDAALAVRDLLGFGGDPDALGADDFAETIDEAMKFVRDGVGARPTYHTPGKPPIELPEIPGFRFYVLGPPADRAALGDLGGHDSSHLYGLRTAALAAAAARGAGPALAPDEAAAAELQVPFDRRHRFYDEAPSRAWYPGYHADEHAWRRLDTSWLEGASDLALQLDSLTNNTSLALAVERVADGRVLLFPADAQQGHWLSWKDLAWTVADSGGTPQRVTSRDLLSRAVFYKVGHHGSHNATARGEGLELMTRVDELTAFIPVDRAVALDRHPKGSWKMPARPLYRRLLERCGGRVARSDTGWAADARGAPPTGTEGEFLGLATPEEWQRWTASQAAATNAGRVAIHDLFMEFKLA